MKRSNLFFIAKLKNKTITIVEIAKLVIRLYETLSKFNDSFQTIEIGTSKKKMNIDVSDNSAVKYLAENILKKNKTRIKKVTKKDNIDINFSWENDISFALINRNTDNNSEFLSLFFGFCNSNFIESQITNITSSSNCFNTFEKMFYFLSTIVDVFDVNYTTLKLTDDKYVDLTSKYKFPLGLITYFSNDYEIEIPNDLEGIEYEFTENGKYLSVVSKDDYKEENIDIYKKELLNVMIEISQRVPEYLK